MADLDIKAIRRSREAATPGEWTHDNRAIEVGGDPKKTIIIDRGMIDANRAFIVVAANNIIALCDRVDELERMIFDMAFADREEKTAKITVRKKGPPCPICKAGLRVKAEAERQRHLEANDDLRERCTGCYFWAESGAKVCGRCQKEFA